jgi:histidinol dehydrogenase
MSISIKSWSEVPEAQRQKIFQRSEIDITKAEAAVAPIIEDVARRGDIALAEYAARFDGADISGMPIRVSEEEFTKAADSLDDKVVQALEYAVGNVRRFHESQRPEPFELQTVRPGIFAGERPTPIDSVGLYVPRGRGSFPSMLYMLAVPAIIAGVPHIAVATPPLPDGSVDPACLYAAKLCGVDRVYRCGGAQAIAALAYGTESVEPVIKVVGPGSQYVTAAKRILADLIDPGLPAGPSESIVLADEGADPYTVALDLLIEAEHGSDSAALLITSSRLLAEEVAGYIDAYLEEVPEPRQGFIRDVLQGYGGIIVTVDMREAVDITNRFATEHLQIQSKDPEQYLDSIRNAGEILLGSRAPFSMANYAVGANAVLPTGGRARTWSSVSVRDFMKYSSVVKISEAGYQDAAPHVETLAEYEGFFTHGHALKYRRNPPAWARNKQNHA